MTRKQMKSQAKSLMKNSTPRPVYVTVIYVVILMAFAILSFKLISQPMNNFMNSQFGDLIPTALSKFLPILRTDSIILIMTPFTTHTESRHPQCLQGCLIL